MSQSGFQHRAMDRDGIFDSRGDYADNPHDPGFRVFGDTYNAPAYPGMAFGIAAALVAGALAYWLRRSVER